MERWKMHRLGFRNFWLYDREDFVIEDGHLLLRGNNASGKSITTQSFIPFILDGNRSPERLDPFGTRERKMDFYLLGDGERDESTGYLFLEFKKQDLEVYQTIGIGLRAQKGKSMDFWGFCLCDGRRIGYDFELYEKLGGKMLPQSKQKLKNIISDRDNWAETPSAYKKLVNDRLYQFPDIRQFDQMVQLLIKVRTPKLSKDAFRPTAVKEILNDSLQVLSDDDLSAMVSTMERMDDLTETLQGYREAQKAAGIIRNEYLRYNQFALGMKGKAYCEACDKSQRKRNALMDRQGELERFSDHLQQETHRQEDASAALIRARAQRDAMGDDDLAQQRRKLVEAEKDEVRQKSILEDADNLLTNLETSITGKEVQLREQRQTLQEHQQAIRGGLRELDGINKILQLDEAHSRFLQYPTEDQPLRAALHTRKDMLKKGLDAIYKLAQANDQYDRALRNWEEAKLKQESENAAVQAAQRQEQEERDRIVENFARWHQNCRQWKLSEQNVHAITHSLAQYRAPSDWSVIQKLLQDSYQRRSDALLAERSRVEVRLEQLAGEVREKQKERNEVLSRQEPIPPRREQTEAMRIRLRMMGIPHAAFYETIDFDSGLTQEEKDRLEAQLLDMGLLDALVVPDEYRDQINGLLEEYPDRFLLPGDAAKDPVTALIPDVDSPLSELAAACLRCISQSDIHSANAILPDGRFCGGILHGRSHGYSPAGFVGAAARRANRERQIETLTRQLRELEDLQKKAQDQKAMLALSLEQLQQDWDQIPPVADLDCAIETLREALHVYDAAKKAAQEAKEREQQSKRALGNQDTQCREACRGLPYARTEESYQEAQDAAEDYAEQLNRLHGDRVRCQTAQERASDIEDQLEEEYDRLSTQKRLKKESDLALSKVRAIIQEVEAYLARPENIDRARRLAELDREIQKQDQEERESASQCAVLQEKIEAEKKNIQRLNEELTELTLTEMALEQYFREELDLGLVDKLPNLSQEGEYGMAKRAYSLIQAADRERTLEQVGDSLRKNFQAHNNMLLSYHPKLEMCFDPPEHAGMLRQRYMITLQRDGREMGLYPFLVSIQGDIALTESVLEENDRNLFENILFETISHKLRGKIQESRKWSEDMSALMETMNTSMGLRFSLEWKPQKAEAAEELDTSKLVSLLNKDQMLLTKQDSDAVSTHFRAKVRKARQLAGEAGLSANYADLIRSVLDYRSWYEFRLYYQRAGEAKKELSNRVFNRFSGGEKAMAMYVPLFAAVSAQYQKAGESCPKLLALDEAFAGVDDRNIIAMFELVGILDFDYIMNSQALWGCYACVRNLNIVELHRPGNASFVTVLRYFWDGTVRKLQGDLDE